MNNFYFWRNLRKILLITCFLYSNTNYADNLIDNPQLIYQAPISTSILDQTITIARSFSNINDLVKRINSIDGLQAKIKNASADTPIPVSINIYNGTIKDLLNKSAMKLGYNWQLVGSTVIFSAINPISNSVTLNNVQSVKPISMVLEANEQAKPQQKATQTVWLLSPSDKTLRNALTKWSKKAGWQLIWNVKADYPITTSWPISGSFETAVNEVLQASQSTNIPLMAKMHDSNRVLEIFSPTTTK